MNDPIRLEWPSEAHARLVLARPERRNALGHDELKGLDRATEVLARREPRVVSIVAEGSTFGVGGDIKAFADALDRNDMERWLRDAGSHLKPAMARLRALDAAVVVGVQGAAAGGTLGLVWAADHVIAADDLRINLAYARLGGSPDAGTSWFLPRLVNPLRAFELFALTPTLDAQQALHHGLVNRVVPVVDLRSSVDAVVQQLLNVPPRSLANIKRLLRESQRNDLERQLFLEFEAFVDAVDAPEFRDRVRAFSSTGSTSR
ncbi:enoyl-CoA hydratase/isomerase family protein [Hydrogenophaga sp. OTU3427]|uniref:enoyl-CoA hydratase/isomerase family protein n=1 Tax=Hydrogenophaga sp. OTU3427 TaxID=3043856 RepID=UPI00313D42BC